MIAAIDARKSTEQSDLAKALDVPVIELLRWEAHMATPEEILEEVRREIRKQTLLFAAVVVGAALGFLVRGVWGSAIGVLLGIFMRAIEEVRSEWR